MKQLGYLLIVATILIALPGFANDPVNGRLSVISSKAQKNGPDLLMEFVIDYSGLSVSSNDQLIVQPVILTAGDTFRLPYLLFPGKIRNKANLRKIRLYGPDGTMFPDPYATLYPTGKPGDVFTYQQSIPFDNRMYGGRLELWQDTYGCADCHQVLAHVPLNNIANRPLVAFLMPQPDSSRVEHHTLYIGFPWDQSAVQPGFRDNASELDKINRSMNNIINNHNGQIRAVELIGYASPEGTYAYNTRLANRRVQAVKNYLKMKYPVEENWFILSTVPEDWDGVKQWVQASGLSRSADVINIIDRIPDPDKRDNNIRRLDGNRTYNKLLHEAYPPLRRVEYKVNYHVAPKSIEQSRLAYQNQPEQLTPYELYNLANSYDSKSPQFSEIILTTIRLYPKNPAALNNAACIALQHEDLAAARTYMLQCQDTPQKLNNQGVLLMLEGNLPEAYQCFQEAAQNGCEEAIINRHNLERTQYQH